MAVSMYDVSATKPLPASDSRDDRFHMFDGEPTVKSPNGNTLSKTGGHGADGLCNAAGGLLATFYPAHEEPYNGTTGKLYDDSAQSRIPRFDSVGSRIPVPGTFRLPAASRLSAIKRPVPSTPISFLRPPARTAATVARSYSGDKLSGIGGAPSPFPVLTASSTPAPGPRATSVAAPFLRKLDAVEATATDVGSSSERLEDIKLCQREFGLPSDDDEDHDDGQQRKQNRADEDDEYRVRAETTILADSEPAVQMLVDESLELVGAHSTDNLLDPPATVAPTAGGGQQQYINPHEHTVTLLRDGNVTYEIRRSATFLKSSHESLNGSGPERARRPVMDSTQSYPHAGGLTFRRESTASIDSPLLLDLTRTMALRRRPSTGELLTDDDEDGCGLRRTRRPGVLNSTMVHERLLNVTQSIPDITQELATAGRLGSPFLVQVQDQNGLGRAKKPNRLTFSNADESLKLMYFSDITEGPRMGTMGPLNSTMHGGTADSQTIAPASSGPSVRESELSPGRSMLLQDTLGSQDQTLVAMDFDGEAGGEDEYAADRRRLNEKLELAGDTASVGDVSAGKEIFDLSLDEPPTTPDEVEPDVVVLRRRSSASTAAAAIVPPRQRYSFGLDLTECTLDCSIELCDSSLSPTKPPPPCPAVAGGPHLKSPTSSLCHAGSLTNQGSFEMDESLGILTPDQMKEFLDSTTTNTTNNTGGNGLELHLNTGATGGTGSGMMMHHHKHGALQHHCRIDQTPSPEELPLDPVGVKTDMSGILLPAELLLMSSASGVTGGGVGGVAGGGSAGRSTAQGEVSQTSDSDPKTDQMTKSGTSSKVSNSFITSITSITSLDTGYQGDGEMSRPASRGADHSPSNGPRRDVPVAKGAAGGWQPLMVAAIAVVPRRQDPMTDSDFFTESDADDVFNRGDARRAQIIDGQLYGAGAGSGAGTGAAGGGVSAAVGAAIPGGANVAIFPDVLPGLGGAGGGPVGDGPNGGPNGGGDDSCMESSGIFTDVENRADDDLVQRRADDQLGRRAVDGGGGEETEMDLSPADTSSDTISSSNSQNFGDRGATTTTAPGGSILCGEVMNSSATSGAEPNAPNPNGGDDAHCDGEPGVGEAAGEASCVATTIDGGIARRSDGGSGSLTVRSTPASSTKRGASCGTSSNRKQTKPESVGRAAFVRKHAVGMMSEVRRVERLSKARLFQDSEGSRDGVPLEDDAAGGASVGGDCGGDQENKRPPAGSRQSASGVVRGAVNLSFVKKSGTGGGAGGGAGGMPNKWDAVMSKIAENKKSVPRKCFGEVKSRVNCGTVGGGSGRLTRVVAPPGGSRSPPSEAASITSRGSTVSKRTVSGSVKRGRTQSKDSQQSSQSDLSLSGGSPKLTPKVSSTRPAKKRDVRTINSSSSDLGPPPSKTNGTQTVRSSAARVAAVLQKRISPNLTSSASIPLVPEQLKASPPTKRNLLLKRSGTAKNLLNRLERGKLAAHIIKDGNKENSIAGGGDHNRLVGASPATTKSAATVAPTHSPKPATKSLIRATVSSNTATANHPQAAQHNHAAGSNGVSSTTTTTVKAIQRNGTIILDKSSTPLLIGDGTPEAPMAGAGGKKNGPTTTGGEQQQQPAANGGGEPNCDHRRDRAAIRSDREPAQPSSVAAAGGPKLVDASLLNHAQKGVEALGVLVQYLVFNLDAFSCPTIKTAHQKTTHDLLETKTMLDDARTDGQTLKQQLLETTARETELQELHRCELSRVESCLTEQQHNADDRIAALEVQLHEKESRVRELLARIDDYQTKLASQAESARLRELDLLQRINALSCTENELRDKVHSSELAFSERLQAAAMRERDLIEQVNTLTRDQERTRRETEQKERELEEKLSITKDECVVLRQSRNSFAAMDVSATGVAASPQAINIPLQLNRSSGNINHLQVLQDEVESLRCVLDLKQREISELRKQTQQYERDAKDLPGALVKISGLESRIEDLQVQLKTKTEEEKELQQKLKHLQDNLCQESKIKTRLSLHNEELQWRLKQNSEKFTLAYAELSKSYHENSSCMMLNTSKSSLDHSAPATAGGGGGQQQHASSAHQLSHTTSRSSCSDRFFDMDDISPPTSPVIKGMVEKSDSVSWVLEIDDEPPEVSASRMVRRAGSFRSSAAYTESVAKRPKCTALSQSNGCGAGIQQSTSATSILRQHSSDMSPTKPAGGGICSPVSAVSQRLRSKSVSIKAVEPPKKIVRSNSGASTTVALSAPKPVRMPHELAGSSWKEQPLYSSSPYAHKRYLSEDNELLVAGTSKQSFGEQQPHQRTKDLFLEETELLSEPESPFATRRRPQSPMGGGGGQTSCVVDMPVEVFHRDKTPNFKKSKENRGLITCDTTALTGSPKLSNGGAGTATAREKRREFTRKSNGSAATTNGSCTGRPLEAAGEALVSGANSDDEASSSASVSSSSSSSSASSSSSSSCLLSEEGSLSCGSSDGRSPVHATLPSGSISGKRSSERMHGDMEGMGEGKVPKEHRHHHRHHRRRHSNVSLEDALMKKIVASLNGTGDAGSANGDGGEGNDTPMEVSWSEDGDPGSESIV
ncbi:streptococcal hemagglutinin [Anopheles cruzii]|uniref:streptococcal hemagglutinin n=1 Tax=Anopheles cruzii TaxID=68878 RepID=UPI0022EC66E6|nr:streptococcal hemagglutinin [Anopheles cruzii]